MNDPFQNLPKNHYGAILADPPWDWRSWRRSRGMTTDTPLSSREVCNHYSVMDTLDIGKLPVSSLAAKDAVLFMWITWPLMPQALSVIERWSFSYKTCAFAWTKADPYRLLANPSMGMGYWTRANSEVCLLATRGKPKRLHADVRQAIIEPRREHSRKPDCVHERIERLVAGPYLELWARQSTRPNWDFHGDQTAKFNAVHNTWDDMWSRPFYADHYHAAAVSSSA